VGTARHPLTADGEDHPNGRCEAKLKKLFFVAVLYLLVILTGQNRNAFNDIIKTKNKSHLQGD
jgi:hypothetical protein